SQTDISQYAESIKALQNEQSMLRQKLTVGLASLSLPMALSRNGQKVTAIVESERIRDEWLHLKQAAVGKAAKIVAEVLPAHGSSDLDPPLQPQQRATLKERLEAEGLSRCPR